MISVFVDEASGEAKVTDVNLLVFWMPPYEKVLGFDVSVHNTLLVEFFEAGHQLATQQANRGTSERPTAELVKFAQVFPQEFHAEKSSATLNVLRSIVDQGRNAHRAIHELKMSNDF